MARWLCLLVAGEGRQEQARWRRPRTPGIQAGWQARDPLGDIQATSPRCRPNGPPSLLSPKGRPCATGLAQVRTRATQFASVKVRDSLARCYPLDINLKSYFSRQCRAASSTSSRALAAGASVYMSAKHGKPESRSSLKPAKLEIRISDSACTWAQDPDDDRRPRVANAP